MLAAAYNLAPPGFSWMAMLALLLALSLSALVFAWQVQRWTTSRGWRALLDWSRERGFTLSRPQTPPGEPFDRFGTGARVTTLLARGPTRVMQLEIPPTPTAPEGAGAGAGNASVEPSRWHVLVRQVTSSWPATGLRPAHLKASLLDQFSLSSYPRMGETERFIVFGTDSNAARVLSKSQARALLPPDIGLLLHGSFIVLDFSTRPFDGVELGRLVAIAEQLEKHLPVA